MSDLIIEWASLRSVVTSYLSNLFIKYALNNDEVNNDKISTMCIL